MSIGHTGPGPEDNEEDDAPRRTSTGQFAPGASGNPKGSARKDARMQARMDELESRLASALEPNRDGWYSALTGIGTDERDKRNSHKFSGRCIPYQTAAQLWEKNDIIAKAIEARSQEAFRTPWEIDIEDEGKYDDLKEEVEDHMEELGSDDAFEEADQLRRAFGGSAILLGADDGRPLDEPLQIERVRNIEWLNVFEPLEISPVATYDDWKAAKYGKPEYFEIAPYQAFDNVYGKSPKDARPPKPGVRNIVHESRLITFRGIVASRYFQTSTDIHPWWGSGTLPRYFEIVRDFDVASAGLGIIMTDVSQPVITMEGLKEMVASNNEKFRARMAAIEMSRSIARAIFLDGNKEKYERQTTQLSGIDAIWDRISQRAASSIEIPLSIMLGYSPATLGTPGNAELDRWYDLINAFRRRRLNPSMRRVASMSMRTQRQRKLPKKWGFHWHDLKTMTVKDQAEAELTQARADSLQTKNGTVHPDEIRKSRWKGGYSFKTKIDESKKAPGFAAPLPAGVLPGSSPAIGPNGKPGAVPGAHTVTSYARRDPKQITQTPKVGGDVAPAANRDAGAGDIVEYAGLTVRIESPKGSARKWTDTDGTTGETRMRYDYGEVLNSLGTDGDPVDVYLGPSPDAPWVYTIHQMNKASGFTQFDEDKCMLGFDSPNHAKDAYLRQYDDERFFGGMSVMLLEDFRAKLLTRPGAQITAELDEHDIVAHLDRIEQRGGKWVVLAESTGDVLDTLGTEAEAIHRLAQIERFKRAHAAHS